MIARVWSAQATITNAPAYLTHFKTSVLPSLETLDGYSGGLVLERKTPQGIEIVVMTLWRSFESIKAFAGTDPDAAVVAHEAAKILTAFDKRVRHYDVSFMSVTEF